MRFASRVAAGQELAAALMSYREQRPLVLAVPRGGVVVASPVASALGSRLDIIIPRKIGLPHNPEVAVAAVTEDGTLLTDPELIAALGITEDYLAAASAGQREEIRRRRRIYCGDRTAPYLRGETVILVDDGIATGLTTKAALASVRSQHPERIVLAVPVAPPAVLRDLRRLVDEVVCLLAPEPFYAVGQFYREFPQVSDAEVIRLLRPVDAPGYPPDRSDAAKGKK